MTQQTTSSHNIIAAVRDVTRLLNELAAMDLVYRSPNPVYFVWKKMRDKTPFGQSVVMMLLHFLQRFQKEPTITHDVEHLLQRAPRRLEDFIVATFRDQGGDDQ